MSEQKLSKEVGSKPELYTVLSTGLCCEDCSTEMEQVDTTYSNIKTDRCDIGQHTGDIYKCPTCEMLFIDNMLSGEVHSFSY